MLFLENDKEMETAERGMLAMARYLKLSMVLILIGLVSGLFIVFGSSQYSIAIICTGILFAVIIMQFIYRQTVVFIEPFFLFSLMYLTTCFAMWYILAQNFSNNDFINAVTYETDFSTLLNKASIYYLIGYICALIGYRIVPTGKWNTLKWENKKQLSDGAIKTGLILLFIIAAANFFYNVYIFSSGNIVNYFKSMALRSYEFETGGTTIGYNFAYIGMYFLTFYYLRKKKSFNAGYFILMFFSTLILASTGRIFQTLSFVVTVIGIWYLYTMHTSIKNCNRKVVLLGAALFCAGLFFYVFRSFSSIVSSYQMEVSTLRTIQALVLNLMNVAFNRGYVVNVSLMPKILDSSINDIGLLHGESLFSSLNAFSTGLLNFDFPSTSVLIKQTWFSEVAGGNLPPTAVGEMYMNFGIIGIIGGMFLIGVGAKLLYNCFIRRQTFFTTIIYLKISIDFFFVYPKNDFSNFPLMSIAFFIFVYVIAHISSYIWETE